MESNQNSVPSISQSIFWILGIIIAFVAGLLIAKSMPFLGNQKASSIDSPAAKEAALLQQGVVVSTGDVVNVNYECSFNNKYLHDMTISIGKSDTYNEMFTMSEGGLGPVSCVIKK